MKRYIACNEVIHIDVKREDETFDTIYEDNDCTVDISYYWQPNSGDLVPFKGPNGKYEEELHVSNVTIVEHSWTAIIYGRRIPNISNWDLYIDNVKQDIEVEEYSYENGILYIDAIVGGS